MAKVAEELKNGQKETAGQNNVSLVALLQEVQERYNYLPEDVLRELAREKNLSLMEMYSVATFYKSFSLQPRGKHKVATCSGTACHVRGSEKVTEELSRVLGIKPGETSQDGAYSLETVNCLGACALAPLVVVDGEYHGNMTAARAAALIKEHLKKSRGLSAAELEQDVEKKAWEGCSCAILLAGNDKK